MTSPASLYTDILRLTSVVIISVSVFNFGLKSIARVNPELLDIIVGSTKLERFAEAQGYYQADTVPSAVADTITILEDSASVDHDILVNDEVTLNLRPGNGNSQDQIFNPLGSVTAAANAPGNTNNESLYLTTLTEIGPVAGIFVIANFDPGAPSGTNSQAATSLTADTYGQLNYDSNPNFQGQDILEYTVCTDTAGQDCDTAQVTLDVTARNDLPRVQTFGVATDQDTAYEFALSQFESNFQDPDRLFLDANADATASPNEGYTLQSVGLLSLPGHGTLSLDGTDVTGARTFTVAEINRLVYTPDSGYAGPDSFSWYGNDGVANSFFPDSIDITTQSIATPQDFSAIANVDITVNPVQSPDLSPLVLPTQTITVRRGETVDSDPITATTDNSGTITGVTVGPDAPSFCTDSTPGVNGTILTCTAPIDTPLGTGTFTVTAVDDLGRTVTGNFELIVEDYQVPRIVLTSDTPVAEVELGKQVCVTGTVTNPNDYALTQVVTRLTTETTKAPFVDGTATAANSSTIIDARTAEILFTIPTLAAGESTTVTTCATPKVTDLSVIDGRTFVTGSDKISEDEVNLDPDTDTSTALPRTGGTPYTGTILQLTVLWALLTGLVWIYFRMRRETRENKK